MQVLRTETIPLKTESAIVEARQAVRKWAVEQRFSLVDQTKLVTAASELARNTVKYGMGGEMLLEAVQDGLRTGIKLIFVDQGPGIPDIDLAMRDGFTTGQGMGLGLGGAKRLVNEFEISSQPHKETRISILRWR
jgi:serine/threonine-protein kinase RsbT